MSSSNSPVVFDKNTVVVVFGASGDLSKKKTFPALFGLFREGCLDPSTKIIGYARSELTVDDLRKKVEPNCKVNEGDDEKLKEFLQMISYVHGPYDKDEGYKKLAAEIEQFEKERSIKNPNRLFYLALPPSVFVTVVGHIKSNVYSEQGTMRVIIEKPFGHDLASFRELQQQLAPLLREEEVFRIDHYLGKEMVKNLMLLRFGNVFFNAAWNKETVQMIQISFKEPFGTEGRGGYFDSVGIIRDVMQNHLLQVLTLLTMERPASYDPESVRDEKVKVLKAFEPIDHNDILIGQYGKSIDGEKPGYLDDDTVKKDSKCLTYAALTFKIKNERWDGVPIVMRAGKALNEGKVEVRIMFKSICSGIFSDIPSNELVIRIQPSEAIYVKFNAKTPGLATNSQLTELDLTYANRFKNYWIPEAYESLIRDALMGDHSNFVRDDELDLSWQLFDPLLEYLEGPDAPQPEIYPYGSRGPAGLSKYLENHHYVFQDGKYQWPVSFAHEANDSGKSNL
ncbi:HBR555Wp [Eremothecium sinecaudum]|uniref:Glucose-6-phosphate 1-dehydrogenase n=1 Tax=Eremothecium sinecaudum TaxID=45286 RepID=A0A120K1L2_9SACH|nr:HBR555Wp [Eremothecium sinecaudum]AMD19456.1 HBR555Wp [Eremothecium sinecaudum]